LQELVLLKKQSRWQHPLCLGSAVCADYSSQYAVWRTCSSGGSWEYNRAGTITYTTHSEALL